MTALLNILPESGEKWLHGHLPARQSQFCCKQTPADAADTVFAISIAFVRAKLVRGLWEFTGRADLHRVCSFFKGPSLCGMSGWQAMNSAPVSNPVPLVRV